MWDAHQLGAELQDVGQRQVADVGIRLTAESEIKEEWDRFHSRKRAGEVWKKEMSSNKQCGSMVKQLMLSATAEELTAGLKTLIVAYLRFGIRSAMPVMPAMMLPWEIMTPLGMPVEPLVYMMTAMSEGPGCLRSTATVDEQSADQFAGNGSQTAHNICCNYSYYKERLDFCMQSIQILPALHP